MQPLLRHGKRGAPLCWLSKCNRRRRRTSSLLSPIHGESNSNLRKDMSRVSQLQLRLRHLHSQATFWIHGKQLIVIEAWMLSLTSRGRSSMVFGVFIFFGSFFLALGLGYRPEMAFVLYFALTFMDAIFSVNPCKPRVFLRSKRWFDTEVPVIPKPSYHNAHTFVVAAVVYVAVSIVSQIIIFPESYNHSWL